ncbi:MAG: hypothetical protein ACC726_00085 [Chloroflexota bacterium]
MATGSTASSHTEGDDPQEPEEAAAEAPAEPPEAEPGAAAQHDVARRAFFLEFSKQAVTVVGQVAGMANIVSRTSGSAASSLLGLNEEPAPPRASAVVRSGRSGGSAVVSRSDAPAAADDAFRSPYRLVDDELMMLDQRGIPESLDEVAAKRGSDVAYYLRLGVSRGGPLMAQVAAYGLALTAKERSGQPLASREVELRRTRRALAASRSSSRLLAWAMERMEAVEVGLGGDADGADVAAALRAEADAIATEIQVHHSAIASHIAELLPAPDGRPLGVLLHGDTGALAGGLVGTALSAVQRLVQSGRDLSVFVTETRPFMDGARLASWQLRQGDVEHKIIADSAVAWLLAREPVDFVLVGAEWIAMDGDVAGVVGSRAIAQQAAAALPGPDGSRPRVIVCGLSANIDPATPDGAAIPVELRSARDMAAYLSGVPIRARDVLLPATDVMPHATIDTLVTERGVTSAPAAPAMAALAAVADSSPQAGPG